ncbi:TetR/AcrR family transcriptional regulator [Tsukamurella spumae]|uniref:TetR/AcrR family transcriptional regulator n=1 Tax=Tsukamurella spumae TaxID=44753 RepID=A0A846X462_9ACTN|nr:TetR/AcrR family transcriptional regulator [Tsukamurella spumae]NKY19119.1 TetR/AcrR family transcriptional regulator [Tsukamurella spumae]
MPPPPAARAKLLDAFVKILIEHGERAATLEAVAAEAGVSKGGLLYHFGSKDALVEGLVARLDQLVAQDVELMAAAPEGAVEYYVRTSVFADTPLDRAIVAVFRLSQGANARAQQAARGMQEQWLRTLRAQVPDEDTARAVLLLGDGLYYNAALTGGHATVTDAQLDALVERVRHMVAGHAGN